MPDNADFGEHHTQRFAQTAPLGGGWDATSVRVEVAARFPDTVICLLTALSFHNLTTQMPKKIWIAYKQGLQAPIEPKLPTCAIAMSKPGFDRGIETHMIEGVPVKIYSVAKTIADCFLYEDLVGCDVSEEAFIQSIREDRSCASEVLSYLEDCTLNWYTQKNLDRCIKLAQKMAA